MLGLANTLSSSSTPESKYSLSLDGINDYVEINDTGFTSLLSTNDDFSISIWFKGGAQTESTASNLLLGFFDSGGDNVLRIGVDGRDSKSIFYKAAGGNADFGVINLEDDEWHNLIISGVQGTTAFFVDGSALLDGSDSAETSAEDPPWDDVARILIGADLDTTTVNDFFEGEISQISMWSENLDTNDIASVYNGGRPINVTYNRGTYDKSANLIGFWQMGNGSFDDKANGVIHDQHNPGFGGELLTNGTFETDTTGWSNLSGATFERNTSSPITGSGDIHWVGGGSSYTAFKHDAAISVVAGRTYRLEYTYKVVGSGEHVSAKLATSAAADGPLLSGFTETALTATSNTSVSYIFTSGATDDVYLVFRSGDGDSPEIYVDNVSLKQLNGLPGLTSGGPTFSSDAP